jgi:hypothetical protein
MEWMGVQGFWVCYYREEASNFPWKPVSRVCDVVVSELFTYFCSSMQVSREWADYAKLCALVGEVYWFGFVEYSILSCELSNTWRGGGDEGRGGK